MLSLSSFDFGTGSAVNLGHAQVHLLVSAIEMRGIAVPAPAARPNAGRRQRSGSTRNSRTFYAMPAAIAPHARSASRGSPAPIGPISPRPGQERGEQDAEHRSVASVRARCAGARPSPGPWRAPTGPARRRTADAADELQIAASAAGTQVPIAASTRRAGERVPQRRLVGPSGPAGDRGAPEVDDHRGRAAHQVAEVVGEVRVEPPDHRFLAKVRVQAERHLPHHEIADGLVPVLGGESVGADDIAK
jgi:hypothetical protein